MTAHLQRVLDNGLTDPCTSLCVGVSTSTFGAGQKHIIVFTAGLSVPVDIAPIAGGVVGGLIAVIVVVLTVIVLVVFLVWRNKGEAAMMCVQCAMMSALMV